MSWLLAFRQTLGIPHDLQSIGIDDKESQRVGAMAAVDPADSGNPIVYSASDYTEGFLAAVKGKL